MLYSLLKLFLMELLLAALNSTQVISDKWYKHNITGLKTSTGRRQPIIGYFTSMTQNFKSGKLKDNPGSD